MMERSRRRHAKTAAVITLAAVAAGCGRSPSPSLPLEAPSAAAPADLMGAPPPVAAAEPATPSFAPPITPAPTPDSGASVAPTPEAPPPEAATPVLQRSPDRPAAVTPSPRPVGAPPTLRTSQALLAANPESDDEPLPAPPPPNPQPRTVEPAADRGALGLPIGFDGRIVGVTVLGLIAGFLAWALARSRAAMPRRR
jgi:hypothetical protein